MNLPAFTVLGGGPTVLMLHGIGGGHLSFAPQVETLASLGYRAVAWDMPGYGRSAPIEPYNFKGLAQSCVTLIEGLMCADVALLGHGMGGMVAQELALTHAERELFRGAVPGSEEQRAARILLEWEVDGQTQRVLAPMEEREDVRR